MGGVELRHLVDRGRCRQPLGDDCGGLVGRGRDAGRAVKAAFAASHPCALGEERRLSRADQPGEVGELARQGRESRGGGAERLGVDGDRPAAADVEARRSSAVPRIRSIVTRVRARAISPRTASATGPSATTSSASCSASAKKARAAGVCQSVAAASRRAMAAASTRRSATRCRWSAARSIAASAAGDGGVGQASSVGISPRSPIEAPRERRAAASGDGSRHGRGWGGGVGCSWAATARRDRMGHMTAGDRPAPFRVVFVCTGNICRSPMAQVVFREFADAAGLGPRVVSTSAGTGDWHVGEPADQRTIEALERRGYDGTQHRARQFTHDDFAHSDLVDRARPQPRAHPARVGAQPVGCRQDRAAAVVRRRPRRRSTCPTRTMPGPECSTRCSV